VALDADAATIRAAYRRRARAHHPDHARARGGAGDHEMAAINEAYRILSDPARRVVYDRQLDGRPSTGDAGNGAAPRAADTRSPTPSATGPARMPWRFMGVMAAFGVGVVLLGAVFTDPPGEEAPDGILRSGSCVTIEPNGDAREVRCTGSADLVVEQLVPIDAKCPGGTQPHRDRLGLGIACVVGPTPG
jgi:molecular chaperone DnaJ